MLISLLLLINQVGKPLFRKTKSGRIFEWRVEKDDPLCTLREVFEKVEHYVGFNIELKFDDQIVYTEDDLTHVFQAILKVCHLKPTAKLNCWVLRYMLLCC
jgi:hypothetical protein